jgi:hypothetical protein
MAPVSNVAGISGQKVPFGSGHRLNEVSCAWALIFDIENGLLKLKRGMIFYSCPVILTN